MSPSYLYNIIDQAHAMQWFADLAKNSVNVERGAALAHEAGLHLPVSVFIEEDVNRRDKVLNEKGVQQSTIFTSEYYLTGYITFLDEDDKPVYVEEEGRGGMHWFKLEASNRMFAVSLLEDIYPAHVIINGMEGWQVSLYENAVLTDFEDANAYFHNIMLWEALLAPREAGPIIQRLTWLSETMFSMHRSMAAGWEAIKKANIDMTPSDMTGFDTTVNKLLSIMEEREQELFEAMSEEERQQHQRKSRIRQMQERIENTKQMIAFSNNKITRAQERIQENQRLVEEGESRRESFERKLARQQEELEDLIKSLDNNG